MPSGSTCGGLCLFFLDSAACNFLFSSNCSLPCNGFARISFSDCLPWTLVAECAFFIIWVRPTSGLPSTACTALSAAAAFLIAEVWSISAFFLAIAAARTALFALATSFAIFFSTTGSLFAFFNFWLSRNIFFWCFAFSATCSSASALLRCEITFSATWFVLICTSLVCPFICSAFACRTSAWLLLAAIALSTVFFARSLRSICLTFSAFFLNFV